MANRKNPPNRYPNPELKHPQEVPAFTLAGSHWVSGLRCTAPAVAFPFSLINPTLCTSLVSQVNQLPYEPVFWPVQAKTRDTGPQHFTLAQQFFS
jgi:hypothetical protein